MKLTFLRLFDNPLSKYLIKRIFCMQQLFLGYLPKLKRGLGIASIAHFLYDFPIKMFRIYSLNGQSFNVISFFLLKIPNKMCY